MKSDNDIVIVAGYRTPIGKFGGTLKNFRASQLAAIVIKELLNKTHIDKNLIDDIIIGDCAQHPAEANTARTAALLANLPYEIPACTIQRQCSSAMQALEFGFLKIKNNDAEIVLAGGTESMSNVPFIVDGARWGYKLKHGEFTDAMWEMLYSGSRFLGDPVIMGETAENLAEKYNISRFEQDEIALRSHNNAERATKNGLFDEEIVPIKIKIKNKEILFNKDEHFRPGLTMEELAKLPPVFKKNGTVTAGNSSGLNDGAALVIIMKRKKAKELGLKPLAKIIGFSVAGVEPKYMGYGPVPATKKLLKKTGLKINDFDLIELHEAFAAQYLACEKALEINRDITNVNGSGIGLGHPVGCTGIRIIISLIYELKRRNLSLGLATLCVGGGMGMATIIERDEG